MDGFFIVDGDHSYHQSEPSNPVQRDLWAVEEDEYIKVYTYVDKEWCLVIGMEPLSNECVKVTYSPDGNTTEDIDLLDYQYRIGVL